MKLDATIQLSCKTTQALQPAMEAGFKLCSGGYSHLNATQGVEGLHKTDEDNLSVQAVIETLDEITPEFGITLRMDVHTHDDLGTAGLAEGVLDAISDIGGQTNLCQHLYLSSGGLLLQLLQQTEPCFTMCNRLLIVVDHIQGNESPVQPLVAHEKGQ